MSPPEKSDLARLTERPRLVRAGETGPTARLVDVPVKDVGGATRIVTAQSAAPLPPPIVLTFQPGACVVSANIAPSDGPARQHRLQRAPEPLDIGPRLFEFEATAVRLNHRRQLLQHNNSTFQNAPSPDAPTSEHAAVHRAMRFGGGAAR